MQKFVTSVSAEFGEPVVVSSGAADAGKIVALDENGKIDKSVLPMQAILPAGVVQYFARQTAPEGWLKADGSAVSRTEYVDLFDAVGAMFGEGDGSTTFNLPDLRGEFVRGYDDGRGVDAGRAIGSGQSASVIMGNVGSPNIIAPNIEGGIGNFGWEAVPSVGSVKANIVASSARQTISTENIGYTRPRNVALLACIKY